MDYTTILIKPLISEKSTAIKEQANQVVFQVARGANKIEVKKAVEEAFKVKVDGVNIISIRTRTRKRFGKSTGKIPGFKKAYITLAPGEKIEFFEGV